MPLQKRQVSIVGSSFYPGASTYLANMMRGQAVRLQREPENTYDTNAVAVYYFQQKLGHLPRGFAAEIAKHMDDGGKIVAIKSRDPKFGTAGVLFIQWETPE